MIRFHKLRYKNILSVGDDFIEVDFEAAKTTLIIGENGGGKSTMIEALVYVLYGKAFRDINLSQLVNSINGRGLLVEVEFEILGREYLVRRGMYPSVLEIYENGSMISQVSGPKAYQQHLENYIVKMTYTSFIHIVILGSANYTPFMKLKAEQRRKITEEFIDLGIFSIMNSLLKTRVKTEKDAHKDMERDLEKIAARIDEKENSIRTVMAAKDATIAGFDEDIAAAQTAAEQIGNIVHELELQFVDMKYDAAEERRLQEISQKFKERRSVLSATISIRRQSIAFYEENAKCPSCGQDIEVGFKDEHITDLMSDMNKAIEEYDLIGKQASDLDRELQEFAKAKRDMASVSAKLNSERARAAAQFDVILRLEKTKKQLQDNTTNINDIEADINGLQAGYDDLEGKFVSASTKLDVYSYADALLKDSGIKARIIQQYVPIINSILNKYLSAMEFSVSFEIDEEFNESIKSRYQDEFSYSSFSQGEKARIDLALLFTWRALTLMRNKANTNLLILDEVFDGSLDANGGDDLLSIIEEFAAGTHIFVITHKTDAYVERFERVLRVRKRQNFTDMRESA